MKNVRSTMVIYKNSRTNQLEKRSIDNNHPKPSIHPGRKSKSTWRKNVWTLGATWISKGKSNIADNNSSLPTRNVPPPLRSGKLDHNTDQKSYETSMDMARKLAT